MECKKFKLKSDKKLPHHYMIGVEVCPATAGKMAGKYRLKYGPVYFHHEDIQKIEDCLIRINDKMFHQTQTEALKIEGLHGIVIGISTMRLSCQANNCTMHHFSSKFILKDEHLQVVVNAANFSETSKKQLERSKV